MYFLLQFCTVMNPSSGSIRKSAFLAAGMETVPTFVLSDRNAQKNHKNQPHIFADLEIWELLAINQVNSTKQNSTNRVGGKI